jgi:hypothetical protein
MRNVFLVLLLCTTVLLTAFSTSQKAQSVLLDDHPDAYVGMILGANHVNLHLSRSGADAGEGCVKFEVDILFNDNNLQTFTYVMSHGETARVEAVQGPNPTGFAEVRAVRIVSRDCY